MTQNLITAAQNGDVAGVRAALDAGADVNFLDSGHDTALTWSSYKGHAAVVRLLLDRGADTHINNPGGSSPLMLARDHAKNSEIVQMLELAAMTSRSGWHRTGDSAVTHVGVYPAIAQKISATFNFNSRDRIVTVTDLDRNLQSTAAPTPFDALGAAAVREALDEFKKRGGTADEDYVMTGGAALAKPKLRAPDGAA